MAIWAETSSRSGWHAQARAKGVATGRLSSIAREKGRCSYMASPRAPKPTSSAVELDAYQKLAQVYLSFSDADMAKALSAGELEEVNYNGEEVSE